MSQKFDWRSEDDEKWEVEDGRNEPGKSTRITRRRWLLLGTVALLILSVGLLSYRQLGRYLNETGLEVEQEILSSNDLVLNAASEADPEILSSLLSGRDLIWAEGKLAILEAGLMFDRGPFGVEWQSEELPISEVTISPGINSADVVTHLEYSLASGQGYLETITLKHFLHYRWSNNRWLLSPPAGDYWGPANLEEGYYLSIGFPDRDSTIGKRLAIDLEGILAALCHLDNVNSCSWELPLQVRLVADPASIVQFSEPESRLAGTLSLELPTPSLYGLPDDEAAYQALYRSYGERVVSAVVAAQIGWQCCEHPLIYQALLDQQLSRLGLIPWPLTADHYRRALNEPLNFGDRLWADWHPTEVRLGTEDAILAHLLIEYIVSEWYTGSVIDLQRSLMRGRTFTEWLEIATQPTDMQAFVDGWLPFLTNRLDSLENYDA